MTHSPPSRTALDATWIDSPQGLATLAGALADAPFHALDLEANSGFAYRERLCLMQWNVGGRLWLVDLLALPGGTGAIEVLRPALEDPLRRTYLHGGEFDVGCLKRDYDLAVKGVWDSQQAATFLGWEKTGYGALVEKICHVSLDKAFAHYDWSRRPLPPEVLRYALDDVRYLPQICQFLEKEVTAADLEEEVAIAHRTVEEAEWSGAADPRDIWRVKGAGHLEAAAQPRLVALNVWRDQVAERLDQPPGRLLNNRLLLAVARSAPKSLRELRRLGLRGRPLDRFGQEILKVLDRAAAEPQEVLPPP
ncbi:MAG: ribonuclease D, partial [Acidobacteria bacterium]|nr:ribonuclease D [Acidobacteriota bacterium]